LVSYGAIGSGKVKIYLEGSQYDGTVGNTTDTAVWSNMVNGAGDLLVSNDPYMEGRGTYTNFGGSRDLWSNLEFSYFNFNTTSAYTGIPAGASVTASEFFVYPYNSITMLGSTSAVLTPYNPVNPRAVAATDFNRTTNTILANNYTNAQWTLTDYHNFTFITPSSTINQSGYTNLAMRLAWHVDATTTGMTGTSAYDWTQFGTYLYDNTGTDKDPYLTITFTTGGGGSAPVAAFSTNVSTGNPKLGVAFTDTSTNSPTSWSWDLKNYDTSAYNTSTETFSTAQNPIHSFGIGNFSITLTATNAHGSDSESHWVNVTGLNKISTRLPGDYLIYPQSDNFYNVRKNTLPVETLSSTYTSTGYLSTPASELQMTIAEVRAINVVNNSFVGQNISIVNLGDPGLDERSDHVLYPIPRDVEYELGSDWCMNIINNESEFLYETYDTHQYPNGTWWAQGFWEFNLSSYELQPVGSAGSGSAGMPSYPGYLRYDEVASGYVNHTLYVSMPDSQITYVWPARGGGNNASATKPPLGQVFKLKASYSISGYEPMQRTILTALKEYGMILGDHNGDSGTFDIYASTDSRWNNGTYNMIGFDKFLAIDLADFEAVNTSLLITDSDSWKVNASYVGSGAVPVASFTVNKNTIRIPNSVTVTDTSTNTPTSWEWSWGDGTANSTTQNPTHQYTKRGIYTINMEASNAFGKGVATAQTVRVVGYENVWY
jgi:PKD repeat protein